MPAPSLSSRRSSASHREPLFADDDQLILPRAAIADAAPASSIAAGIQNPILRSINETAAVFHRTPRTIRNWIAAGHLQVVRVGRAVFVRQEEINRVLGIDQKEFERKFEE